MLFHMRFLLYRMEGSWDGAGPSEEVDEASQQHWETPSSLPFETSLEALEGSTPSSTPAPPTPAQDPRPAARGPSRHRTLARRRVAANDKLISALQSIARPPPQLSAEAHFLLSMEESLKRMPEEKKLDVMSGMITLIKSALPECEDQPQPMILRQRFSRSEYRDV